MSRSTQRAREGAARLAVIGTAFRLPGASTREELWEVLTGHDDPVTEVPLERWDVTALHSAMPPTPTKMNSRRIGTIGDIERFDANFFGVRELEAESMDPQQRILLETSWAALEDAGIAPDSLSGTRTGVFVGAGTWDYNKIMNRAAPLLPAGVLTGTMLCMAANRVSYMLDLIGPSMTIDSASSSALVALHLAIQSLRSGESELALVAGVNLILSPETSIALSQAGLLSAEGLCKSFDESASGYVRGEGCGVVVLRRLADAILAGDRIEAEVCGSAVNHNGRSNGLVAPRGIAQQRVMREALADAQVHPAQIGYVEAHAIGAPLADLIEAQAIKSVLAEGREAHQKCIVSSVDSCLGHLEHAAGIAKLIATLLYLQRGAIPGTRHLANLNNRVATLLGAGPLEVAAAHVPWPSGATQRFAGISSFGFGGANAHVIVAEPLPRPARAADPSRREELFTLRAKSRSALRTLAARHRSWLSHNPGVCLGELCHTANTGRALMKHRVAIVATSLTQLQRELCAFAEGSTTFEEGVAARPVRVAFVWGEPSPDAAIDWDELDRFLGFREALAPWAAAAGQPIADLLRGSAGRADRVFAVAAINAALGALWRDWGVQPVATIGCYRAGEIASACVAGELEAAGMRELLGGSMLCVRDVDRSLENCADVYLELAPDSQRGLGPMRSPPLLTSLDPGVSPRATLLRAAGALFVAGSTLDFSRISPRCDYRKIALPTYPFEGTRYWSRHPSARELHRSR